MAVNWLEVANRNERARQLLARFGADACSAELVTDGELCGHITAAARIWNPNRTRLLRVWNAKNQRWQLPGAHGEGNFDLEQIAHREALRALGLPPESELNAGPVVEVQSEEVAQYWNTPTHLHLAIVFEFQTEEQDELPRGAQWFDESDMKSQPTK